MGPIIKKVSDLKAGNRQSIEDLIGCPLNEDQKIIVQVVDMNDDINVLNNEMLKKIAAQNPPPAEWFEGEKERPF